MVLTGQPSPSRSSFTITGSGTSPIVRFLSLAPGPARGRSRVPCRGWNDEISGGGIPHGERPPSLRGHPPYDCRAMNDSRTMYAGKPADTPLQSQTNPPDCILVVGDDDFFRQLNAKVLLHSGCEVDTAGRVPVIVQGSPAASLGVNTWNPPSNGGDGGSLPA